MVLVDTSVWISHFREGNPVLATLLNNAMVLCHPLIVGELSCGNLKNRAEILSYLRLLPMGIEADHDEAFHVIESNRLMGKGIGYIDVQLIASALLTGVSIWTLDKRLAQATEDLNIRYFI